MHASPKSDPPSPIPETAGGTFPIVGIGASAGGLDAVTRLLQQLPPDTGMAFVYVQHLSPDHKSLLSALLSNVTQMTVLEVTDRIQMRPDHVYVIPPDKEMAVMNGHIKLTARSKGPEVNLPIDAFFCTLADTRGAGAVGIILSGNASDGTRGLLAIKKAGGLTFAQDDSARNSSMPRSAIAAGAADFILSPEGIAQKLAALSRGKYLRQGQEAAVIARGKARITPDLAIIFRLLHAETGVDFGHYKPGTIKRRIERRMLLHNISTIGEYAKLMAKKNEETNLLYQDLLIHVTDFFRDFEVHRYLRSTLLPRLLRSMEAGETLRIWVPACATGQEAYSIAMAILEIQSGRGSRLPVQIFATDLSAKAIAKARSGEFNLPELESITPRRLKKFYTEEGGSYRIAKQVRDMCVFAPHNILQDPPFSHVDFISCRNLLIYLDLSAQKKVLSAFHFALNDGGYLMLGKSETVGASIALFTELHTGHKIYSRNNLADVRQLPHFSAQLHSLPAPRPDRRRPEKAAPVSLTTLPRRNDVLAGDIDAMLLSDCMPACVAINHSMDVLEFRGEVDLYFSHSSGKATLNIQQIIRPELAMDLRLAIHEALRSKANVVRQGIELTVNAVLHLVSIRVVPVLPVREEPMLLILFSERPSEQTERAPVAGGKGSSSPDSRRIRKLEADLADLQAHLVTFSKEQEAYISDLQHAGEEEVSSNEELQSLNEELETSKEEIESVNEELITTNQELQVRNNQLAESYEYAEAIITTIHEPMLILDKQLRVKSANQSFYAKFGVVREETVGVVLFDLAEQQWDIPGLRELMEDIIPRNMHIRDYELTHRFPKIGERVMLLNARRIEQKSKREQLILLAIKDISTQALLQRKERELLLKDFDDSKADNLQLEKAVNERTAELHESNARLEANNRELKKMNIELQAFAYISSHDLQEPLRKIQTFASRIISKELQRLTESGKDSINRIQAAAGRMRQLIDDLLAFCSLNTDDHTFEEADMNELVAAVIAELQEAITEKDAIVTAKGLCRLRVIPFQFRQLLHNLICNALKFSRPGTPPRIVIKCVTAQGKKLKNDQLSPEANYCHLSVKDNGIGFDQRFSKQIFEVFQRLHGAEHFSGTGIGLAIVKKIVGHHHGLISATATVNGGATFNIYIPISGAQLSKGLK